MNSRRLSKASKIEFDKEYRAFRVELERFMMKSQNLSQIETNYFTLLRQCLNNIAPAEQLKVLMDLNHMHLNRLFLENQPFLESKAYYILSKMRPASSFGIFPAGGEYGSVSDPGQQGVAIHGTNR